MKKGFTLLEIIITTVIVSILATISITSYFHYVNESEVNNAQYNLSVITGLEKAYYYNNGNYCISNCSNEADINKNLKMNIYDSNFNYSCKVDTNKAYCCVAENKYTNESLSTCDGTNPLVSCLSTVKVSCNGGGCIQNCTTCGETYICNGGGCTQTGVAGCNMICNGGSCVQSGNANFTCNGRPCTK